MEPEPLLFTEKWMKPPDCSFQEEAEHQAGVEMSVGVRQMVPAAHLAGVKQWLGLREQIPNPVLREGEQSPNPVL